MTFSRALFIASFAASASLYAPVLSHAQTQTSTQSADQEDPNDKAAHDRSFEETRQHMQHHSEWSKKTGKMNDN